MLVRTSVHICILISFIASNAHGNKCSTKTRLSFNQTQTTREEDTQTSFYCSCDLDLDTMTLLLSEFDLTKFP